MVAANELRNTPINLLYKKLTPFPRLVFPQMSRFDESLSTRVSATPVRILYHTFLFPKSLPNRPNRVFLALASSPPLGGSGVGVSFGVCFIVVCEFKE